MVSLTDTEQVAVFQAAAPLPVARRSEFISAVLPTSSSIIALAAVPAACT